MKIRMGFVSNSSSSSFTMVGVRIDHNDAKSMESGFRKILSLPEDNDLPLQEMVDILGRKKDSTYERLSLTYIEEDGDYIFGISVSYGDDIHKTPIYKIVEHSQKISQFLQYFDRLYGLPASVERMPSLFSGLMCC